MKKLLSLLYIVALSFCFPSYSFVDCLKENVKGMSVFVGMSVVLPTTLYCINTIQVYRNNALSKQKKEEKEKEDFDCFTTSFGLGIFSGIFMWFALKHPRVNAFVFSKK
jgi:hypothetical protein